MRNTKGFTLVEILVSLVILSIGFLGVIGLLAVTIDKNRLAGQITEATTLAQDRIESLRNSAFVSTDTTTTETGLTATGDAGGIYDRTTIIDNTGGSGGWNQVQVDVEWARNGTQTITLRTIITP